MKLIGWNHVNPIPIYPRMMPLTWLQSVKGLVDRLRLPRGFCVLDRSNGARTTIVNPVP